jgi:hypothetical protein
MGMRITGEQRVDYVLDLSEGQTRSIEVDDHQHHTKPTAAQLEAISRYRIRARTQFDNVSTPRKHRATIDSPTSYTPTPTPRGCRLTAPSNSDPPTPAPRRRRLTYRDLLISLIGSVLLAASVYIIETRRDRQFLEWSERLEMNRFEQAERLENTRFVRQVSLASPDGAKPLEGLDLRGAGLAGLNLTDANLAYVDLTGADLTGADLTGANLFRSDLTDASLFNANLANTYLAEAKLTGADLSGADLAGVRWCKDQPPVWPSGFDPPTGEFTASWCP